jgi:hypothetical protein
MFCALFLCACSDDVDKGAELFVIKKIQVKDFPQGYTSLSVSVFVDNVKVYEDDFDFFGLKKIVSCRANQKCQVKITPTYKNGKSDFTFQVPVSEITKQQPETHTISTQDYSGVENPTIILTLTYM